MTSGQHKTARRPPLMLNAERAGSWPSSTGPCGQLLFAAVNGRKPRGLEITLDGAKYTRLIVSLDQPDAQETALTA